jgi:hypothetical protein
MVLKVTWQQRQLAQLMYAQTRVGTTERNIYRVRLQVSNPS